MRKRLNGIQLIKNKWIVSVAGLLWGAIIWGGFQWLYTTEIELERLALTVKTPDPVRTMHIYEQIARSRVRQDNLETFIKLGEVLERAEQGNTAIEVWRHIVTVIPEDTGLRTRLALSLHNTHHYTEAEAHFAILLQEGSANP